MPLPRFKIRFVVLVPTLIVAVLIGWQFWPAAPELSVHDLSRVDGQSRFYETRYSLPVMPENLSLTQKIYWKWQDYRQRHGKQTRTCTFPATPVRACSIPGLLAQCMEVTGTRYFLAVEIAGGVDFGHTNALNGSQLATAFESAIETNGPTICYDYATKKNFNDTLLLIREKPGQVKIVPCSKLAEYQRLGLIRSDSR
jgi:hypothetical protein